MKGSPLHDLVYAFVEFTRVQSATEAVRQMNGSVFDGRELKVGVQSHGNVLL